LILLKRRIDKDKVGNRECCIRCGVGIIVFLIIFIPRNTFAQAVVLPPKEVILEMYLDRLENSLLRQQEEERALRKLTQEQMIDYLLNQGLEQNLVAERKPKESMLKKSFAFLEDMFMTTQLSSRLITQVKYDDNVKLDKNRDGDWIYTFNPSVNLKLTRGQSYLGLDYNLIYDFYNGLYKDAQTHNFTSTLFFKPSNIFSFQLNEIFEGTRTIDLFALVPFTIDRFNRAHQRVNANKLNTVFTYMPWGRTNLAHLKLNDERAYSQDHSLDNNTQTFEIDIEHYLNPITSVYFGLGLGQTNYEEATTKDKGSQSNILGLKYDLTNITKAEATFTYDLYDYDDGTDEFGYTLDCTLRHKISNLTHVAGTYRFAFSDSESNDYRRYHTNKLDLSLNHQFTQTISLSTDASYTIDNYLSTDYIGTESAIDKERRQYSFGVGLNRQLYKWLNLSLKYNHSRIISEFADEGYRDNLYTLGARMDF